MRDKVGKFLRIAKSMGSSWNDTLNQLKSKVRDLSPEEIEEAKIYFTNRELWLKHHAPPLQDQPEVTVTKTVKEAKTATGHRILILTPFRNEAHSVSLYLESLKRLEYPKSLIEVYWLENDSSDRTLKILKSARPEMPFKSTTLKSIKILGSLAKRKAGEYFKDISHGGRRVHPWLIIWNKHFLPIIRKSPVDYVLVWYADVVAPPNIITEYLKVFKDYRDAGWVGGAMHRRHPRRGLAFPNRVEAHLLTKPLAVRYLGHCWMCPRHALAKTEFSNAKGRDIHLSLIRGIGKQKLKVYYQPSVYLKHVSTDGKIYNHSL